MPRDEEYDEDGNNTTCLAMGCDIRPWDVECRRCGAEVVDDPDEDPSDLDDDPGAYPGDYERDLEEAENAYEARLERRRGPRW